MKDNSIFIGMDVHKNSIDIAVAEKGRTGPVRHFGKIVPIYAKMMGTK